MSGLSWRYRTALILSGLGAALILYFALFKGPFNDYSFQINPDLALNFGGFIGGIVGPIFSLAGVFMLFETLIYQRTTFQKQQFENRYFELLKIHRENVAEMIHIPPDSTKPVQGRRVFVAMRKQFGEIYGQVCKIIEGSKYSFTGRDKVNISYLVLFFGVGETSKYVLEHYIYQNYANYKEVIDQVVYVFAFDAKHDGHQSRLGHYFRHLFQTVKFIDKESCLSESEKYFYVKTLRAQLSTFELAIFFFNSLSDFGKPWSMGKTNLIEKYHFIKNIPAKFTFGIDPKTYYPNVKYEFDEIGMIPS